MISRRSVIYSGNFIYKKYVNKNIDNGYKEIYNESLYQFLSDTITTYFSQKKVIGGKIEIDYPIEISNILNGISEIRKTGVLK